MNKGVISMGVKCPIIHEGDDIVSIVYNAIMDATDDGKSLQDKDVVGITESVVARSAGQYISVDDIAADIEMKFGNDATICLVKPIYSRNRFSMILKGIARASNKLVFIMPEKDEVGNPRGVNKFTGVNIEKYYKEICENENCECDICDVIDGENIIDCRLHKYFSHKDASEKYNWYSLADICSDKSPDWGVLGTNKATEEKLKLFPSKELSNRVCEDIKKKIFDITGKDVIVMVYGDGCFHSPDTGVNGSSIWEFADPVTSPGYTDADILESTPNELKLKAFAETNSDDDIKEMVKKQHSDSTNLVGNMSAQGTTPRKYHDLLASLMDLTSGSGDKGTPIILVQNYFNTMID